ncbi:MAG TPA: cysteine desulfurase-like protein [Acidimicrobiia bacterium]|jgi:cysteine desulfurase family protein (TIGR01976 family)|nr:cysteine desulfurase-like protein [Acidimicrobiia bacterium]
MLDVAFIRQRFPALARTENGRPVVYADGPGGTQVPESVIEAMSGVLAAGVSNLGGPFAASREAVRITHSARRAVADLLNAARPEEISFGQNMTSLTLALGRALARTWAAGDEIICTRLDHDANVSSWMQAAGEAGAFVRLVDFDAGSGRLDPAVVAEAVTDRTRLIAVTHASNAIGTVVDVTAVAQIAREAGALSFVDAVHYTPHGAVDVAAIGCDFLAASAYKFFGPHTGVLYARLEQSAALDAVKIRPAPTEPPGKWESGTQSFESVAGVTAAVDYLASLGDGENRRAALATAMHRTAAYELTLSARFLEGIRTMDHVRLYGIDAASGRTPTFAIAVDGHTPREVAVALGRDGIYVWDGHYYALEVMRHLGVLDSGGLVRIGFVHYNTEGDVDRVLEALEALRPRCA